MKIVRTLTFLATVLATLLIQERCLAKDITLNVALDKADEKFTQVVHVGDRIGIRWYKGALIIGQEPLDRTRIDTTLPWTADAGPDEKGNPTVWYMFKVKKVGTVRIQMQWCDPNRCSVRGYIFEINP